LPRHHHSALDRRPLWRGRERGGMLALKPDMASLATGSVNFPTRVYENSPELVDWLAAEMLRSASSRDRAFDLSMLFQAAGCGSGQDQGAAARAVRDGRENRMPVDRRRSNFTRRR